MTMDQFLEYVGEVNKYSACCNGVDCQECEYLPECAEACDADLEYAWELKAGIYDPPVW